MARKTRLRWVLVLLHRALLVPTATAQMPYNPTRVFQNNDTLYVFRPSSQPSTQFQLSTIRLSGSLSASNLPYNTLYSTLPFLDDTTLRPFTPLIGNDGNLTVYTGDCSRGATGAELWTYTPDISDDSGKGSWRQENVSVVDTSQAYTMGANYLSGGMTFSSVVPGNVETTGAYLFGGMCPNGSDTASAWQSAANYSNSVVTLEPSGTSNLPLNYQLDISPSRGPPVPEAGFTVTGLSPTFSDRNDGTQIQQQNFLLIGGHTSAAFINMSQIALFSLPEQGWTFIPVQQPTATNAVEPRSGHTAVLSLDGKSIIVIGGWVGDINTPAEPQYVVLNLADGYGGNGDWEWVVPSTTGAGLPSGSGLYGHGAAMLPGGVLMVTGGYSIPSSSARRRDSSTVNTQTYFLNTTSNTWITDYTSPKDTSASSSQESGLLSTTGQKAGLGIGIGIGLLAVCGLALCLGYKRRSQNRRRIREKQLQDLSYTAHRYNLEDYASGFDGHGTQGDASDYLVDQNGSYYFPSGAQGGQGWKATTGGDVERTGLLVEIPSPTRGLRRSLSGRPAYVVGRPRGPSGIHPIDELEEEIDQEEAHDISPVSKPPEMAELKPNVRAAVAEPAHIPDPSVDAERQDNGHEDVPQAASALHTLEASGHARKHSLGRIQLNSAGRISPERSSSERTGSNLSDMSVMSWTSSNDGAVGNTLARSCRMLANAAGSSRSPTNASPTKEKARRRGETDMHCPDEPRTNSFNSERSNGHPDLESFRAAQSSFAHLQAEGEALLGGNPERPRPNTGSSKSGHDTDRTNSRAATATPATSHILDLAGTPQSAPKVRRTSWLGSVRRVLTRSASGAERTRSMLTPATYHEPYRDDPASPVEPRRADMRKSFPAATAPPQRAASDASFWRNRRGKKDWLDDEQDPAWRRTPGDDWGTPEDIAMAERERQRQEWRERATLLVNIDGDDRMPTPRSPILPDQLGVSLADGRPCTPASEADWDVEAAVERRVVQVMFTVPKSKLRVVNADVDGSSVMSDPQDGENNVAESSSSGISSSRVKDLAGRFEQMNKSSNNLRLSPRTSPRPSPSNSIKSMKIRPKASQASLARQQSVRSAPRGSGLRPLSDDRGED